MRKHDIRKEVWKIVNKYLEKNTHADNSLVVQAFHINKAINIAIDETIRLNDKRRNR